MQTTEIANRCIRLLDLTSLGDDDDDWVIDGLCGRALNFRVAAVCVWPWFVDRCREQVAARGIRVATVVNFPHGGSDVETVAEETVDAIEAGADEIDMVMAYGAWLQGDRQLARDMIDGVKRICGDEVKLKVILETGRLRTRERIAAASRDAIEAGADFLKTSTGKIRVSATPGAAEVMLRTIRESERPVGFKAAGGIRSLRQAANYLRLADQIMWSDWAQPETFRFGASGLLDACLKEL